MRLRLAFLMARLGLVLLALAVASPPAAAAARVADGPAGLAAAAGGSGDPLLPILHRMDRYFRGHEVNGVTMDWRYGVIPSEEVRQTVVCQVLGYAELYKVHPSKRIQDEVAEHADFLIARLDSIRSHTPFDGMLGYCLLEAHAATGEPRFLAAARTVMDELMAIPTRQCILNGGLMVAMAMADQWRITGDAAALQKTRDILTLLPPYQNPDGSFPHWCVGSEDIHYTGWMAQELNHIQRLTGDPRIEPMLARMRDFLEARVDSAGHSHYEGPCPDRPGCTRYYYSRASGCDYDYDTRGWTVEPAYIALLFDRYRSPKYAPVMRFLDSLETGGTFPDLWDYWPPPSDPEYPWTIADTSAVNMSIIFWTLASIVTQRHESRDDGLASEDGDDEALGGLAPPAARPAPQIPRPPRFELGAVVPSPARDGCEMRFTLPEPARVALAVYDVGGRRVRDLGEETLAAGEHVAAWDLRDDAGARCRGGVYFLRLRAGAELRTGRVLVRP